MRYIRGLLYFTADYLIPFPNFHLHFFSKFDQFYFSRKKIEELGKMTEISQEEISNNTKTVIQGLETLKNEHNQILNSLLNSMKTIKKENGDTNLVEEKTTILKKTVEMIDLGLGEAHVSIVDRFFSQKIFRGILEFSLRLGKFDQAFTYVS